MSPQVCAEEEKKKRKTKVRVDRDTLCMDTRSIAGVYQRFFTPLLHQQLHTHYFRTLSMIIINRSEIVATERRQMLLFELTRRNEAATAVRERDLQKTWRKRVRQDYMRLFRSELGKKIFGRSQRKVLAEVFKGWVRYWSWHRGHKEAFQLKYAVIKHGVDLRRLHPKILGMRLPGRVVRDDDVPTLEGYDKRVDTKPVLEIEPEPEPEPEVDPHADDPLDSPETRRKKVSDSAQKMNLNLTWSPRRRRRDAASPRRRRRGRQRVHASRRRAAAVSRRSPFHTGEHARVPCRAGGR